jgi:hypothetical protein
LTQAAASEQPPPIRRVELDDRDTRIYIYVADLPIPLPCDHDFELDAQDVAKFGAWGLRHAG